MGELRSLSDEDTAAVVTVSLSCNENVASVGECGSRRQSPIETISKLPTVFSVLFAKFQVKKLYGYVSQKSKH